MFTRFELHERLLQGLDKLGITEPTPIQQAMIPPAMAGRDIQASAETGSGKTAAFLLPVLDRLLRHPAPNTATRCLVLLPTRELAAQIHRQFRDLAAFTPLKAGLLLGGENLRQQQAMVRKNPELLIGTPGRVREHVERKSVELGDLEVLVLDEADRMLDMGFRDEVMTVVRACNPARQTMLLSATLRHTGIGRIAGDVLREPEIVAVGTPGAEHAHISQQVILADDSGHKRQLLNWLLAHEPADKVLVFCNTRAAVIELEAFLRKQRERAAGLHGEMEQAARLSVMRRFREGAVRILAATDLAARGLDIEGVDLVINFALARSGDEHVHRIGRTGRAGRQGLAISLVAPQEWNRMEAIERYLGLPFERREVAEHPARFKGPVARKKPHAKKKLKEKEKEKKTAQKAKTKERHRNRKNVGKRRQPSASRGEGKVSVEDGGFVPLTRKKP